MLIIVGSRRNGNSAALANYVTSEIAKDRIHAKVITPGNQRIHICTGCMDCDKSGVCDFTDDMKENIEMMKKEDIIMFITPTRWNLLSGDMKIFMDRLNPMYARRELAGKKGIVVAIGAQPRDVYSSYEASASVRSFLESAGMACPLVWNFYDCKEAEDLLEQRTELERFMAEVKKNCI